MKSFIAMLFVLSMSGFAFANAPEEPVNPNPEEWVTITPEVQGGVPYRLFRAEGTHICWSNQVIGNTCFVTGVNYTDCLQAHYALKAWDCCRNTPGSHSVNFVMSKCTNW